MMKMIWWMFVPFKWTSQYPFPRQWLESSLLLLLTNTMWHHYQFQFVYLRTTAVPKLGNVPLPNSLEVDYWVREVCLALVLESPSSLSISGKWKPTAEDSLFLARNWILKFWNGGRVEDSSNAILAVEELAAKRPISLWATDFQRNPVKNANDVSTETHKINVSSTL